ncbi:aldehyde dehydrogenase family protein [Nocardia sp. CA-120079]|uniref:aldehyde dehydrogenase family protein n=1 Tax=Nocardia sp. CA-120079 TaxID=3239974 RepID=UPI003D98AF49
MTVSITAEIPVENPATGELIGMVPNHGPDDVASAVARASVAQPNWQAAGFAARAVVLDRCRRWFMGNSERIIDSIVAENGKPHEDAVIEVAYCMSAFAFWVKNARKYLADEKVRSRSPFVLGRKLSVRYVPVGVVGVIGPWNNPLLNSFGDAIPALAAGNAVVLKPSEITPLTALLMAEMARDCGVPDGVFTVITGDGRTGAALVDHVDFVMFTGSTRTGRTIAARAGDRLIPVALELGGKDPLIVLRDADLERAANLAVYSALQNTGQTCTSTERVYVEEPVYEEFVAKVVTKVQAIRQGVSTALGTVDVGPMTFPPQIELVEQHVREAIDKGARALVGGRRKPGTDRYFEPTVLVDVDHSMSCMRKETFGPTIPIMKVRDAAEAIRLANDTDYGLQASVYGGDVGNASAVGAQLRAGVVTINDSQSNYLALDLPMGGWGSSGLGARHGAEGIRKYTRKQAVMLNPHPTKSELHQMPFKSRNYRLIMKLVRLLYGR